MSTDDEQCVGDGKSLPSMTKRSRAEVVFDAHWLSALGKLSMENLVECLRDGDRAGLVDAGFRFLPGVRSHLLEYDPVFWHDNTQIARDLKKTKRMLRENPDVLVVRVRIGAPRLEIEHERLVILYTDRRLEKHATIATELGRLLAPHLSATLSKRLLSRKAQKDRRAED
eukprot:5673521-Prymnesium_polylepis.1